MVYTCSYGSVLFVCLKRPLHQVFWRYRLRFGRFWKKNNSTIIFSDFFSVLDRMKKEFSGPNFGVLLSLGFLIYGKFWSQKGTPSEYTLAWRNFFSMYVARKILEISLLRHRKFRNFSQQQSPLSKHLWVCHRDSGDPLYVTGVMLHFRHYKNVFLWSGAYLA